MCKSSIYDARNNFSALVKMAEEGEVVQLTRYDKPVAVIISWDEYGSEEDKGSSLITELAALRQKYADVLNNDDWVTPSRECPDYSKDPWA